MDRSQWYIGTPNGAVLCVDRAGENQFTGRLYHAYSRERVEIEGIGHLLFELERFFDSINFPHVSTNERTFREARQAADGYLKQGRAWNRRLDRIPAPAWSALGAALASAGWAAWLLLV